MTEIFNAPYGYCPECASLSYAYAQPKAEMRFCENCTNFAGEAVSVELTRTGWFYWFCQPGCLPDSEPFGPFTTAQEAEEDAASVDFKEDDGIAHTYTDEDEKLHGD